MRSCFLLSKEVSWHGIYFWWRCWEDCWNDKDSEYYTTSVNKALAGFERTDSNSAEVLLLSNNSPSYRDTLHERKSQSMQQTSFLSHFKKFLQPSQLTARTTLISQQSATMRHNLTPAERFFFNFILFNFTILYWFCHISKWICHRYTCVPQPEPSSLPIPSFWVVPVHHPQASSIVHWTWTGNSFHIWYYTYFNAILPNHPTLSLSHRVQKTVLYICVSFAVSYTGLLLPSF